VQLRETGSAAHARKIRLATRDIGDTTC